MADIVLVAGAFHGGWYFDPIIPALETAGHRVIAPTLPGLESGHPPTTPVNLETHVTFLNRALEDLDSDDVVLVGHSYAGMVITGAAARAPRAISRMIYLDSPVPSRGQRVWDLIPLEARNAFVGASPDGYLVFPEPQLAELDPRVVPHPLATFIQPLDAPTEALAMPRTFVVAQRSSSFRNQYDRLVNDGSWATTELSSGHDFVREAPEALTSLLLEILDSRFGA